MLPLNASIYGSGNHARTVLVYTGRIKLIFMKRLKFLLAIFAAEAALLMVQSCIPCGKNVYRTEMKMNGITALAGRITATAVNSNGTATYKIDTLKSGSHIRYDSLYFLIGHQLEIIAFQPIEPQGGNSAYACKPNIDYIFPAVSELSVVSDQDYMDGFPKGANLKNLLTLKDRMDYDKVFDATEFGARFRLDHAPKKPGKHTFTVTYKIREGGEFTAVLKDINLY